MLHSLRSVTTASLLAVLFFIAPVRATGDSSESDLEGLKIVNAWIEMPLWEGDDPPVYFTIMNANAQALKIIGASSSHCERMEIRRATIVDGKMVSEEIDDYEVPGNGGAVAFAPRGLFLRMIDPTPMNEGDRITIELELSNGRKVPFQAAVKEE
jgi:copper(I)-binding protein